MTRITLDLIRKRSEHNEGDIATLEEIALHQENIEKIELLGRVCKDLKILLLQNNLIAKLENLSRLKSLEYLNLALNNIEHIENLEQLESLKKLDLTVNFIGDLRGIQKLRCNENLEQLFLMGNPCADYTGYRDYAIATLTQLRELDGLPIERSDRIKALQIYSATEGEIVRSYGEYRRTREKEIGAGNTGTEVFNSDGNVEENTSEGEQENEQFWKRVSRHTPEERVAIAERALRREERANERRKEPRTVHEPKLFNSEGKPYNVNQPKVPFKLNDEERDVVVLEVSVYKYLDTDYVHVDVHPDYVRVAIKGKILQLTLPCEVSVEASEARRNAINGKLAITMPRLSPLPILGQRDSERSGKLIGAEDKRGSRTRERFSTTMRQYLEIGPAAEHPDFSRTIAERSGYGEEHRPDEHWNDSEIPALE
ncbi:touch insensitive larva B [Nomia melanderi]|uniref:touch insensitive larva B n=1 Tax=Nomia melanderi TaxID=2448451 RepID=UPI003FCDED46